MNTTSIKSEFASPEQARQSDRVKYAKSTGKASGRVSVSKEVASSRMSLGSRKEHRIKKSEDLNQIN